MKNLADKPFAGRIRLLVLAVVLAAAVPVLALEPGAETAVDLLQNGGRMLVFLPSNYATNSLWPAVFFYHGQGGQPTTAMLRRYTNDRDFIVVGMPYLESEPKSRTAAEYEAHVQRELGNLRRAREWLDHNARVDPRRVYLGGASLGGWTTTMLGERELPRLAGLIVLLAGRVRGAEPAPAILQGKPVYFGSGETDPNLFPARLAAALYRQLGARVTFEEYTGIGHDLPADAPRLRGWLEVEGRLPGTNETTRAEWQQWYTNSLAMASAESDPLERYRRLRDLTEDPRLARCDPSRQKEIQQLLQTARAVPLVRDDWAAEQTFDRLLVAELRIQRLDQMKAVRDGFQWLSETYPATRWGRLAAPEYQRLAAAYQKSLEATERANAPTNAPAPAIQPAPAAIRSGRDDFPVPRRQGNRITFDR